MSGGCGFAENHPAQPVMPIVTVPTASSAQTGKNGYRVPILMFHYVRTVNKSADPIGYDLSVNPDEFNLMMAYLYSQHYQTVTTAEALAGKIPAKGIILSFDDGYDDFYTLAYPALKKYHYTAVLAMITDRIDTPGYLSSKQLKEISDYGIEIYSHTIHHPDLSKDLNQRPEIFDSKKILENLIGKPVIGFVYPSGKYNDETLKLLAEAGYKAAFTEKPRAADFSSNTLLLHRIRIRGSISLMAFELMFH